jgi:aryl-alcohol dehydrogenase-like predicted oxidoreductase
VLGHVIEFRVAGRDSFTGRAFATMGINNAKEARIVTVGTSGPEVSRIGLGCMGMSGMYGPADRAESIATINAAIDSGINLLDTGDFYGMGHNEMLVGDALKARGGRDQVLISVKFGAQRGPDGAWLGYDARPQATKTALAYSLQRLQTDYVDIYRPARLDPQVPIEETVGTIAELIEAGYVRHIGLSEVGPETIRRAVGTHPIVDLQIEYSLISRGIEAEILPTCRELGIGITAYGVLSRGLISGHWSPDRTSEGGDVRSHMPRFQGENLDRNLRLVDALRTLAEDKGVSVAQLAIAWVLARGEDIVPLIGARTRERLGEALEAQTISLADAEIEEIERAVPADAAAGSRYAEQQMAMLDAER